VRDVLSHAGRLRGGQGAAARRRCLVRQHRRQATPSAPLPYIAPGDPEGSYLWAKLNGTQIEAGGDGSPMPLGVPLDDATLAIIEQWILEGANP